VALSPPDCVVCAGPLLPPLRLRSHRVC
jgi:hypothetical protein